jgi:hypothetical protein
MNILASDVTQSLNDVAFLLCLANGAINFFISRGFCKEFHPVAGVIFVMILILSDQLRIENPTLMFTTLGLMGSVGGGWLGLSQKKNKPADSGTSADKMNTEQDGTGQPATRRESKSEGNQKP